MDINRVPSSKHGNVTLKRSVVAMTSKASEAIQKMGVFGGTKSTDLTPADLLVIRAALSGGATPAEAVQATRCEGLADVRRQLHAGATVGEIVIADLDLHSGFAPAGQDPLPTTGAVLLRALAVAETVGAPPGESVTRVLDAVVDANRLRGVIKIKSAQAVLTAQILSGLPALGVAGMGIVQPSTLTFFLTPIGAGVGLLGVMMVIVAAVVMFSLIKVVASVGQRQDPVLNSTKDNDIPMTLPIVIGAGLGFVAGIGVDGISTGVIGATTGIGISAVVARKRADRLNAGSDDVSQPETPSKRSDVVLPTAEAIELLALGLGAGSPLGEACATAGAVMPPPLSTQLSATADRLAAGHQPTEAFSEGLSEVAHIVEISRHWGAPTAQALRTLAADLRSRAAIAAEEAAEQLAVRLVLPTSLLLVPAFVLLVMAPFVAATLRDMSWMFGA